MKKLKVFIICLTLSFILQGGVLYYFDKVLFKESEEITIENVESPVKEEVAQIHIPSNAKEIQSSYSGRYISYFLDGRLILVNTRTLETKAILEDTNILNIKWVPNNNTLFVVENSSNKVNVKTYNAKNGVQQDVGELCPYKSKMKIESFISTSAEYISITNDNRTVTYRVNIDKEIRQVDRVVNGLGSADVFWNKDIFIYQDEANGSIYRYTNGESERIKFNNLNNLVILRTVNNKVYLGEYTIENESKKIVKVIFGENESNISSWETKTLEKPVDIKDIYISENNEVFINDSTLHEVNNIITGEKIEYQGEFVLINERVLFSLDNNNMLNLKKLK